MRPAFFLGCVALLGGSVPAQALEPAGIILIINKQVPESRTLAEHYCRERNVPKENIVALDLPKGEDISRADYDQKLVAPLREALKDRKEKVKVLLTFYGVPLRVDRQQSSAEEKAELDKLRPELDKLRQRRNELAAQRDKLEAQHKKEPTKELKEQLDEARKKVTDISKELDPLDKKRNQLEHAETEASVDSELSLLWQDGYTLYRWVHNTMYWQTPEEMRKNAKPLVMTCRLDGPSVAVVKRLIDDAVAVEKKGLVGKVYVDARGIRYDPKTDMGLGYGGYDESMREMAKLLDKEAGLPVVLDDRPELFAPGSCPDCAFYCGWYSHANYIPCCKFVPGAIAWHLASSEAVTLRNPQTKQWCKNLLDAGVAATLGPVGEPYTLAFPKPAEFFGLLATGQYTLVECYWRSTLFTSWMMTLVGDPLYNPFAATPKLKVEQVKKSPAAMPPLFREK
jgi:uncharacterized protein (TIGR03790 family)